MKKRFFLLMGAVLLFTAHECAGQVNNGGRTVVKPSKQVSQDPKKGSVRALVIGISGYNVNQLHFAETDAQHFSGFLRYNHLSYATYDGPNVKEIPDTECTWGNLLYELPTYFADLTFKHVISPNDEFYFYFSGHGMVDSGKQSLVTRDYGLPGSDVDGTIDMDRVMGDINALKSKSYVIIDACRDGGTKEENDKAEAHLAAGLSDRVTLILSVQRGGEAYEDSILRSGVFSYFFLLGLEGACIDSTDKQVRLAPLMTFVRRYVPYYTQKVLKRDEYQYPVCYPPYDNIIRPITTLDAATINRSHQVLDELKIRFPALKNAFISNKNAPQEYYAARGPTVNGGYKAFSMPYRPVISTMMPALPRIRDSLDSTLYRKVVECIKKGRLISDKDSDTSAYTYYKTLEERSPEGNYLEGARKQLCVALIDKPQGLLDQFLAGHILNPDQQTFDRAADELVYADSLLTDSSHKVLKALLVPRRYFFRAAAFAASHKPSDWKTGLKMIDSAVRASPGLYISYYIQGLLCYHQNRFYTALNNFKKVVDNLPKWPHAYYMMGSTYYQLQEFDKSIQYARRALQLDTSYTYPYSLIGLNYGRLAIWDSAVYYNQRALQTDPANTSAYYYLARIYFQMATDSTRRLGDSLLLIGGNVYKDANCLTMLGQERLQFGRDSGVYYLIQAVNVNPFNEPSIAALAEYYYLNNHTYRGDSLYQATIHEAGDDTRLFASYRSWLFRCSPVSRADSLFRYMVSFNNEDPKVFIEHSNQYESSDPGRARSILYQGLRYDSTSIALTYELASFYFRHLADAQYNKIAVDTALSLINRIRKDSAEDSRIPYALYQIYTLKEEPVLARQYLISAQAQNRYITSTDNFNRDLMVTANGYFSRKDYLHAIKYFRISENLMNNNKDILKGANDSDVYNNNLRLAQCFYLNDSAASAYPYVLIANTKARSPQEKSTSLNTEGLILFDQGKTYEARDTFENIHARYDSSLLEEAVCWYSFGQAYKAKDLALRAIGKDTDYLQRFVGREGLDFSSHFTSVLISMIRQLKLGSLKDLTPLSTANNISDKQMALNNVDSMFMPVPLGISKDSLLVLERGLVSEDSLSDTSAFHALDCADDEIGSYRINLANSRIRGALNRIFRDYSLTNDFIKNSFVIYIARGDKIIGVDLQLNYVNPISHQKVLSLLGIDRQSYPKGFSYKDNKTFTQVYQASNQHTTNILYGHAKEYRTCSFD